MTRIKLTEDDVHIVQAYEGIHVRFMSLEGDEIVWEIKDAEQLKQQILDDHEDANAMRSIQVMLAQTGKSSKEILEHFAKQKEKAEKWDVLENAKTYAALVRYAKLVQENKELQKKVTKLESKLNNMEISFEMINDDRTKFLLENKKLKEIVEKIKHDEQTMGRALVDVQNWLSKDGKKSTEIIHSYLQELLATKENGNKKELLVLLGLVSKASYKGETLMPESTKRKVRMFDTHPNKIHEFSNGKTCDYCKLTKIEWDWLQRIKRELFN